MKFVRQFMIILTISFVGELLHALLTLPVPASIYGLVLMLIGLQTGILPLSAVNEAGGFLIEIMPMLFIPAGVGSIPVCKPISIRTRPKMLAGTGSGSNACNSSPTNEIVMMIINCLTNFMCSSLYFVNHKISTLLW